MNTSLLKSIAAILIAYAPALAHASTDVNVSTETGVMHIQIDGDQYDSGKIAKFVAKNPNLRKYIKCAMSYDYEAEGTMVCSIAITGLGDLAPARTPGQ